MTEKEMNIYWSNRKNNRKYKFRKDICVINYDEDTINKFALSNNTKRILINVGCSFEVNVDIKYFNTTPKIVIIDDQEYIVLWYSKDVYENMLCISLIDEKIYNIYSEYGKWKKVFNATNITTYMEIFTIKEKIADEYDDIIFNLDINGYLVQYEHETFVMDAYKYVRNVVESCKKIDIDAVYSRENFLEPMLNLIWEPCFTYLEELFVNFIENNSYTMNDAYYIAVINGLESICCDWRNYI